MSIKVAKRLEHLAAVVEALGKHTGARKWFETFHPGLRAAPEDLLLGEWDPADPKPAMLLVAAQG